MLYDRPVSDLMAEANAAMGDRFSPAELVTWFADHYPKVKEGTVRAHAIGLTANDPSRHHYPSLASKSPLFFKLDRATLTHFDPDRHIESPSTTEPDDLDDDELIAAPDASRLEFYLEAYLEEFLMTNWHLIDWGRPLRLWVGPNGQSGHQLSTPVGRLDFLCIDEAAGALIVVELKRGLPSDRVVGQIARYIGWVRSELAGPDQVVEGLIVAHESDDRLRYSVDAVPGLGLLIYEVTFALRPDPF